MLNSLESRRFSYSIYNLFPNYSYKNEGILYPSGDMQEKLIREFYESLKLDPRMVSYVEAHGTGKLQNSSNCRIFVEMHFDSLFSRYKGW